MPIETVGVHPKVKLNAGIKFSLMFSELDACINAGLNPCRWFYGAVYDAVYPKELKALIVAWHEMKGLIALHNEDARFRKSQKK